MELDDVTPDELGATNAGVMEGSNDPATAAREDEKKCVKALIKEYKEAREFDKEARKQFEKDRAYASGRALMSWASSANIIGTFIDILVSFLYAKDPDIVATPSQNVGGPNPDAQAFGETATLGTSRLWKQGRLKKTAKRVVRSALSVGQGWMKVLLTQEMGIDPVVQRELNDLEDNMRRLEAAQKEIDDGELDSDEVVVKMKNMALLQESLQAKVEVVRRYGFVMDFVPAENMQVSLDVAYVGDYLDAEWNGNEIYVLKSSLTTRFPNMSQKDADKATNYYQKKSEQKDNEYDRHETGMSCKNFSKSSQNMNTEEQAFARVIEIWDRRDNHIKTMVEGIDVFAVAPYQLEYWTSRFFPYFMVTFYEVDGERHPQSLPYRLMKLQDEYSSRRSNGRLAQERSIPGIIFDRAGLTEKDVKSIVSSTHQEYVGINPTKGDDLRKLFAEKPIAKADPFIFDTSAVMRDMERIGGIQEALSQSITQGKTATEAKIQDQGFNSRTGADRDALEDMLQELAEYSVELAIQGIPAVYMARLAGPASMWPEGMDPEDVVTLVELEIMAGSSGKKNEEELRQSWSIILPLVEKMMMSIQQAQLMGNLPLAEAMRNLLQETFRRLDERISVDKFIPQGLPNLAGVANPLEQGGEGGPPGPDPQPDPAQTSADANTLV